MSSINAHRDFSGRLLAFILVLLGVGLLCGVFSVAWSLFQSPVPGLNLPVKAGAATPPAANIGLALTAFVRQLLLLAVMIIAGSLIAGKGVQLYFGTAHPVPPTEPAVATRNGHEASPAPAERESTPKQTAD